MATLLNGLLLAVACLALYRLNSLAYIDKPRSIDDVLLFLAMSGGLMYHVSLLYAASYDCIRVPSSQQSVQALRIVQNLVGCFQQIVQVGEGGGRRGGRRRGGGGGGGEEEGGEEEGGG